MLTSSQSWVASRPGKSSVRNGEAGRPSLFHRLSTGELAQPKRTATGFSTWSLLTTTLSPLISALASWNFLSSPATVKPVSAPSFASRPLADAAKAQDRLVAVNVHPVVDRAGIDDFLAVSHGQGGQGQTGADRLLVLGMNVVLLAHVGDDGHAPYF